MSYYYKRPGDWLWHPHDTSSLAEDVRSGRLRAEWRYRIESDPQEHSLAELLEAERARQSRPLTPAQAEMLAPDGTWGFIVVIGCSLLLLLVILVPTREGAAASSKFYLAGLAVFWMGWGIQQIRASRAWKRDHANDKTYSGDAANSESIRSR